MKITEIKVFLLQKNLSSTMRISRGGFNIRNHTIVEVHTDEGITGLGEGVGNAHVVKAILEGKFKSSRVVVIEEFLQGEELSYFVLTDGENFKFFGSAQDHKKVGEGDVGPNTGGMGAYSPAPLLTNKLEIKI